MAIKGKSRPKGRRAPARPPRPTPVVVRPPLLARRGLWVGLGIAVVALVAVAILISIRDASREAEAADRRAAEARVTTEIDDKVTTALEPLEWRNPPDLLGKPADLAAAIAAATDDASAASAALLADDLLPLLTDARAAIDAIDVTEAVRDRGFGQLFVLRLIQARERILDALDLYRSAAQLTSDASALGNDDRTAILASAAQIAERAKAAFDAGYQSLVEAQVMAGTYGGPPAPAPAASP